ncbi:hypothetical protein [Streptomyces gobitricini]|uniref:Uncharacterized protein n=1 Tax=Streptomyces gobitricini TaxID=68211 RepID=A0ABN3MS75_9ACTN
MALSKALSSALGSIVTLFTRRGRRKEAATSPKAAGERSIATGGDNTVSGAIDMGDYMMVFQMGADGVRAERTSASYVSYFSPEKLRAIVSEPQEEAARLAWAEAVERLRDSAEVAGLQPESVLNFQREAVIRSVELARIRRVLAASLTNGLSTAEREAVAADSGNAIDHALAMLFLRLGPPPGPTELDYTPAGNGGGGAQQ